MPIVHWSVWLMVPSSTYRVNYAQSLNMWPESLRRGDIHDICPNAVFFTSIPGFKSEETDSDDDDHTDYPTLMISFFMMTTLTFQTKRYMRRSTLF